MKKSYKILNYESFEQTMWLYCKQKGSIEIDRPHGGTVIKSLTQKYLDGEILLPSGMDDAEAYQLQHGDGESGGATPTVLSKFRNGTPLYPWIVSAYASKDRDELEKSVTDNFRYDLMTILGNISKINVSKATEAIWKLIDNDSTIPQAERNKLRSAYESDDECSFLAKTFVYSIIRYELKDEEFPLDPMIVRVLDDINKTGYSDFFDGLLNSIYHAAVEGITEFETMRYWQEDIITFVLGVLPIYETLTNEQKVKYNAVRVTALNYEWHKMLTSGNAGSQDELFARYGFGEDDFEVVDVGRNIKEAVFDIKLQNNKPYNIRIMRMKNKDE